MFDAGFLANFPKTELVASVEGREFVADTPYGAINRTMAAATAIGLRHNQTKKFLISAKPGHSADTRKPRRR